MSDDATILIISAAENDPYVVCELQEQQGFVELDWLPWKANPILYPVEDLIADCLMTKNIKVERKNALDYYRNQGVTHVVMLPSSQRYQGRFLQFGEAQFQLGIVLYWCAAHNKYRLLHCGATADMLAAWIDGMQEVWGLDASIRLQEENSPH